TALSRLHSQCGPATVLVPDVVVLPSSLVDESECAVVAGDATSGVHPAVRWFVARQNAILRFLFAAVIIVDEFKGRSGTFDRTHPAVTTRGTMEWPRVLVSRGHSVGLVTPCRGRDSVARRAGRLLPC